VINALKERQNACTGKGRVLKGQQPSAREFADNLQKKANEGKKKSKKLEETTVAYAELWGSGSGR
jgi:hypothetical protein